MLVSAALCGVRGAFEPFRHRKANRAALPSHPAFFNDPKMQVYRNVFSHVPANKLREVSHMLKAIHAQENRAAAEAKAAAVVDDLRRRRMGRAAELVDAHVRETLT
jgi:Transposase, Mutator family